MANCVTNDECGSKHFYSVEEPEEINRLIKRSEGWDETFAPPPPEFQDPDPPKTLLEKFAKQLVTVLINESFNQAIENRSTCYEELSSAKQNNSCEILKKNLLSESQIYPEQKIKDNIYEKHYKSSIKQDNSTKIKKLSCHIVCCTQNIDPCFPELQENNPEIKVESHHCTFPENVPSTSELNLTKQENSTETPYSGLQLCSTPAYCTPDPGNINQENISKISQNHNWTPEYTELENTSEILKNRQLYTSPENNPCWTPDGQKEELSINHYSEPWNPEKQENSCEILTNWTSDQETTIEASKNPSQHEKSGSCWTSLAHKSSIAQEKTPDQSINHYSEPWNPELSPKKQTQNSLDSSSNLKNGTCWTGYKCTIDQEITKTPETSLKNSKRRDSIPRWTPELPFSPGHHRPGSRGSLASSRLSISHNSLNIPCCKADDSSFITLAMSHDVLIGELTASEISDIYNVPFDSDIYAVPIDMLHPVQPATKTKPKRKYQRKKKRSGETVDRPSITLSKQRQKQLSNDSLDKRYSVPAQRKAGPSNGEPIHMTLQEVRQYLQNLYSSSSDSSERTIIKPTTPSNGVTTNNMVSMPTLSTTTITMATTTTKRPIIKNNFIIKNKKTSKDDNEKLGKCNSFSTSIKQTLCSLFRIKKMTSPSPTDKSAVHQVIEEPPSSQGMPPCLGNGCSPPSDCARPPFSRRALPPLPASSSPGLTDQIPLLENGCGEETVEDEPVVVEELSMDFAASIEKVKDYGWYWGPISGETAEKILSTEPDGSFIVRDSSDHHYIFSLTFRLNGCVRHVRIEHDQGNFSFGSCTKFKSHTIVDFIENAVEHSRSGRYLFFLHRRPVLGPMRVQLLHPVSRFKQVQSLQHMCRFVILKLVRRDLIGTLPLPRRVLDYLSTPHYYAEQQLEDMSAGSSSAGSHSDLLSFVPHRPLS